MKRLTDDEKAGLVRIYCETSISLAELIDAVEAALIEKNQ
jgi:hypothetical protein